MPDIKEIRKMLDYKNPAEHKIRMVKIMLDDVIEKEALEQPSNMVTVPLDKLEDMQRRLKALEQPAQEPRLVSYALDGSTCTLNIDGEEVYFNREQPSQEPVGKWESNCKCDFRTKLVGDGCRYCQPQDFIDRLLDDLKDCDERIDELEMKDWQGLTEDEIAYIVNDADILFDLEDFASAIEQALKEKNHD